MSTMIKQESAVRSPFDSYLREINNTALLTADKEKELAYEIRAGESDARDHMIRSNLRLVVKIARSYLGRGLPIEDLVEEGNLGLIHAVEKFDPTMNTRFSTYASYWIKHSMQRAVVNTARTIRVPAYMFGLVVRWEKMSAHLQDKMGRSPTDDEVATALKLPNRMKNLVKNAIQLYQSDPKSYGETSGNQSRVDTMADKRLESPPDEIMNQDCLQIVHEELKKMDPREAEIVQMRFGLAGTEPKTLREIGERVGLTRERVRQIERDILKRLAVHLSAC